MSKRLLDIQDLHVSFDTYAGEVQAVRGVSLHVDEEEILAIVGESGCGKSVTAQSVMQLNPAPPAIYKSGSIQFSGKSILDLSEKEMQKIRGNEIGMIFQDPITSLNPTATIGKQISESLILHQNMSPKKAMVEAERLLKLVQIPNVERRIKQYPHQYSGGMRQRAMIAMALACKPKMLIADEPTTALDVTIQAQIIELLKDIRNETKTAIILITHNLGMVASLADRIAVMYAGKVVETGDVYTIFRNPKHPYTAGLQNTIPRLDQSSDKPLVTIEGTPPDLLNPPKGCGFCERCPYAMTICKEQQPPVFDLGQGHTSSCWLLDSRAPHIPGYQKEDAKV